MTDHDIDLALFLSFRYALGRRTYVVEDVKELLIKYRHSLHENTKRQIKAEIEQAIENDSAGMQMDIDCWNRVVEGL